MAPATNCENVGPVHVEIPLVEMASTELNKMRLNDENGYVYEHTIPPACLALLKELPGNHRCIDCGSQDPQWATVSYGALLCLSCSGRHRSLGVQVSCVRSITMDNWSPAEVLAMLEGGNTQLHEFFERHALCEEAKVGDTPGLIQSNVVGLRYKTKAAEFYRKQMGLHVSKLLRTGQYKGRQESRRVRYRALGERNSTVL